MPKRPGPVPVRFPPHELAALDAQRGEAPRGTYIRDLVAGRRNSSNINASAQAVSRLGQIAEELRRIGRLFEARDELDEELRAAFLEAWADLAALKHLAMRSLRIKER